MSTLLIWSDEIQKLSDLIKENKKIPSMFDKFTVLGLNGGSANITSFASCLFRMINWIFLRRFPRKEIHCCLFSEC